jgi:hypothetical protein
VNLSLSINSEIDIFNFSPVKTNQLIEFDDLVTSAEFICYLATSLQMKKPVLITNNQNTLPDLKKLKANHFFIENENYIYLNISLKNIIEKINLESIQNLNYQELESVFRVELPKIFN